MLLFVNAMDSFIFDFEIKGTEGEGESAVVQVELVCELRASRGTVWFDEASLEVIREND